MTVEIQDKINRVKGLIQCLGILGESDKVVDYYDKPHWHLIETIDEQLESINEWLKEADDL